MGICWNWSYPIQVYVFNGSKIIKIWLLGSYEDKIAFPQNNLKPFICYTLHVDVGLLYPSCVTCQYIQRINLHGYNLSCCKILYDE